MSGGGGVTRSHTPSQPAVLQRTLRLSNGGHGMSGHSQRHFNENRKRIRICSASEFVASKTSKHGWKRERTARVPISAQNPPHRTVIVFTGELHGLTGRLFPLAGRLHGLAGKLRGPTGRLQGVGARLFAGTGRLCGAGG